MDKRVHFAFLTALDAPYAPAALPREQLLGADVEGVVSVSVSVEDRHHSLDVILPGEEGVRGPQHLLQLLLPRRDLSVRE